MFLIIFQLSSCFFRAGRLIGTIKSTLEFLVDLDEDEYPVDKIA